MIKLQRYFLFIYDDSHLTFDTDHKSSKLALGLGSGFEFGWGETETYWKYCGFKKARLIMIICPI